MTKTMKTFEAIELYNNLKSLIEDKRKMPGNASWAIGRTYKKLDEINKSFEEEKINKLRELIEEDKAETVPTEDGQGENVKFTEEGMPEFVQYINEIANDNNDIEIHTISQETFDKLLDTCELSIVEADALGALLEEANKDEVTAE